jgi:hypothetical protein
MGNQGTRYLDLKISDFVKDVLWVISFCVKQNEKTIGIVDQRTKRRNQQLQENLRP